MDSAELQRVISARSKLRYRYLYTCIQLAFLSSLLSHQFKCLFRSQPIQIPFTIMYTKATKKLFGLLIAIYVLVHIEFVIGVPLVISLNIFPSDTVSSTAHLSKITESLSSDTTKILSQSESTSTLATDLPKSTTEIVTTTLSSITETTVTDVFTTTTASSIASVIVKDNSDTILNRSSVTSLVQPPKTENEKESAISSVTTTRPVSTSKIDVTVKDTTIDDVLSTTAIAGSLVVNSEKFIDTSEPNSSSDSIKPTLKILQALPEQLTIPPTRSSTSFDSQTLAVNLPTTSLSSTILPSSILPDPTITQSSNLSTVDIITTTAIVVPTSDKSERLQEPPSTITSNEIASTSSSTDLPNTIAILNRLSAETVSSTTIFATLLSSDFTTSIQPTATPSRLSPEQLSSLLAGTSISFDPQILIVNLPSINVPATTTTVGSNPPVIQLPPILGLPLPQIPIPTIGPVVLPSVIPGLPPVIPVNLPSIISAIPPVIPTNLPVDIPGVPPVPLPVPPVPRATPTLPIVIPGLPPIVVPPVDNTITASAPTATPSRLSPEQLSSLLAGTSISFDPQILIVNLPSINVPATTTTVGSNPPVIQLPPILGLPLPQIPIPTIGPVVLPSIIPGVPPVIPVNLPSIISAIPPVIPTNLPVDIPGVPPVPLPVPPVPRATPTLPIVIPGLPPIVVPPVDNTITASAPTATPSRLSPEQLSSLLAGTSISFDPQILIVNLPSINVPATTTTVGSNPPVIQLPPILGLPLPQIPIPTIGPVVLPSIIPGVPPVIPINLPSIISAIPSVIPINLPSIISAIPPVIPTNLPVDIPGLPPVIPVNLPSIISAIPPVIPTNLPVDIPGVPPVPLPVPPVPRATPTLPIVIPGLPPIVVPPVDNTITASAPTATPSRLSPEQLSSLLAGTSISFDPQILIVNLPSINVPATTTTVGSNPPVIQLPPILGLPLPQIPIPTIGPVVLPSIIPGVPPVIPVNLPSIISAIPSVIPTNLPVDIPGVPPVIPVNLPSIISAIPSVIPINLPSIISAIPPVIPTNLPVDIPGVPPVPLPVPPVPRATPTLPIVIPGLPPIVVPPVDNTITASAPTATPSRLSPEQLSSLLAGTSISFDPQILIVNLPSINVPATTTTVGSNPPVIQLPPILGLPLPQIPIPTIGPVVLPSIIPGVPPVIPINLPSIISAIPSVIPINLPSIISAIPPVIPTNLPVDIPGLPPVIPVNLPSIISAIPPVIPTNLPVDIPGVPPVPLPVPPVPRATPTLPIVIPGLPPIVVPPVDNTITASAPTATPSRLSPEQLSSLLAGTSISFDPQILIVNLPSINVPATTTTVGSNPPVIQLPPILGLPLPQIPIPTIGPVVLPSIIPGVPPVIPVNLPSIISAIPSVIPINLPSIISAIPPVIPTNLPVDIPGLPPVIPVNLPSIISAIPPVIPTNLPVDIPGVPPVPLPVPPVPRATPTLPIVIPGLPPIVVPPVDNTITASAPTATPSRLSPEQLSSLLAGTSISFDPQILIVNLPSINVPATTTTVGSNPPVIQLPPILGLPLPQIPIPTIGPVVLPSIIPGVPSVIPVNLPSIISAIPPVIPTNLPVDIPGLPPVIPVNLPSIISAIPPVIPTNLPVDIPGVPPVPLPVPPVPRATPTLPIVIPGLPPIVVPPVDNTITASAPTATPSRLSPEQLSSLLAGTSISFDPQILIVNLPSINVPATTTTVGSNPPVIQLPPILGLPLPQIPIPTIGPVVLPSIIPGVPPVIPINLPSIISAIPSVIPINLPSIISAIPPVIPTNLPVDIPGVPPVPLPVPPVPRATPTLPIVIPGLPPIVVPPVDNTITASAPTATPSRLSPEQLSSLLAGTSISFDPQILIVNLPSINVPATTTTVGSNPPVIQLPPILGLPLPQIPIPTIGPVVLPSIIPGVPPVIPINLPSIISAIPSVIPINLPSIISAIPPVIPTNLPIDIPGVPPVIPVNLPSIISAIPPVIPTNLPVDIPGVPPVIPVNLPSIIPVVSVLNIPTIRKTSLLTPTEIAQPASTEPFLPAAPLPVSKFSESFSSQQVDGGNSIPASIPTSVNGDITVPNQSQFPGQFNIPVQQPNSVQFQSTAAAEATIIFGSGVSNVPAVAPDATVNPVKDGSIITASGSIPIPPAQHASHDEVVIQDSNASQIVSPTLAPVVNIVANNPGGAVIVGGKQSNPIPSAQPGDIVGNSGPTRNNGPTSDSNTTTPPSNNNGMSATTLEMIFGGIGAGLVVLGSVLVVTRRSQLSLPNASSGLSASENGAASTLALPIAIVGPVLKSGKDAAEGVVVRPESHRSTLPPLLKLSNSKTKSFSIFSTESLFSGLSLSTIAFANQTEATDIESPVEKKANTSFSIDMHDDNHQASTHTNYGSGESMPEKSLTSYIHPSALSGSSLYSDIDAVEPVAMPNIASNTSPFVAVPIDNEISFTFGCGMSSIDRVSDLTVTTISTNPWRRQSDMEAISTLQRNNSVCSGVHITDTMDSWRISHISKAPTLNETTEFDPDKTFSGKYQYVTHGITETQRERISFENNSNVLAEKALDKHTESYFDIDQETGEDKSSWFDEQSSGALSGAGIFSQPKHTVANCNPSPHENLDKFSLADYVQDPSPRLGYIPREYKPRPILRDSDYDEHTQSNGEWTINDTTVTGFDYSLHNQSRRSSITFASQSMEFH
ncbi:hypothetical protein BDV3_000876 [Batrachochytrium dendrobatidis]